MTICPLMLLASLCRFSQSSSTVGSQQLAFDSYQQFEDITPAAELSRKQTAEAVVRIPQHKPMLISPSEMFDDPWHAPYYGDILIPDFWYRVAQEFRDSEFLWAAVQTSIGPEPIINGNKHNNMHRQWKGAYTKRFGWFIEHGIEPQIPQAGSSIAFLSPEIHYISERLYLCAGRETEQPFSFLLSV